MAQMYAIKYEFLGDDDPPTWRDSFFLADDSAEATAFLSGAMECMVIRHVEMRMIDTDFGPNVVELAELMYKFAGNRDTLFAGTVD